MRWRIELTDTNRSKVYSHENWTFTQFFEKDKPSQSKAVIQFSGSDLSERSGDDTGVVTPVPIPNTEVKHSRAKNSYACHSESRTLPVCPGFGPGFFIVWYLLQQVQASVRDRSLAALKPFRFFGVSGAGILWMSFSFFVFFSVLLFSSCWLLKCIDQNDQVFFKLCRWVMTPAEPCYVRYLWMQLWFHETKHYIEIY